MTDASPGEGGSERGRDARGVPPGDAGAPAPEDSGPRDPGASAWRPATSLLTWGTVAIVLVIVVALVVIKVTGGAPPSTTPVVAVTPAQAAPSVVKAVSAIPAAVYDAVGVTSSDATVTPPTLLHGQPPLTSAGKPEVVFVGNEFCPYCAALGWALVAALSRFGTFGDTLFAAQSGSNEAFPNTPTFSFDGSSYESRYLTATFVEHYGDQKDDAGTAYAVLEPLTAEEKALIARYDRRTPGAPGGVVPFVDIANQAVVAGGEFSPSVLQQLDAEQIAAGLTDPADPATQAILAAANYLSAVICRADGELPTSVCSGAAVTAAASALGLAP